MDLNKVTIKVLALQANIKGILFKRVETLSL